MYLGKVPKALKALTSALKAKKILENGCTGYLVNLLRKDKEAQSGPEKVPIVKEFIDVFSDELQTYHQNEKFRLKSN